MLIHDVRYLACSTLEQRIPLLPTFFLSLTGGISFYVYMATVFIPPSPQPSIAMSNRRTPLDNVPNGTNSPHRGTITSVKRTLPGNCQTDVCFMQPPPKKQMLEKNGADLNNKSPRKLAVASREGKVFTRKNTISQPSAFERKLVAARDRDRANNSRGAKYERAGGETLDSIRQWQKHYRKAFPQFVFYFESIPEDVRNKCSRQIMALGAVSYSLIPFRVLIRFKHIKDGFCWMSILWLLTFCVDGGEIFF